MKLVIFEKSQNSNFLRGLPMVLGMEKVGQGNVFGNNLHGKQAFLDYNKSLFKWSQNYNLLKRLTHDLAHKLEVF